MSILANRTDFQISTDAGFGTIVVNDSGEYRTSRSFSKGDLPFGVNLYARARHEHPDTGLSNWSNTIRFKLVIPANIIGVCLDYSASAKGTFYWINALGNKINFFDWQSHPTYENIAMVTMDADRAPVTMTRFPLFYVKTATSGPVGSDSDGMKCWWISDIIDTGFRPAAAFKRSTDNQISDYCHIGTFLGHTETAGGKTVIGSKRGQSVRASAVKNSFKTWITNRNNASAGQSGWRMFDIWDLGVLRILLLIAKANSDTQVTWGDNTAATSYPKTGSTNARAVFQGTHSSPVVSIEDLWRCYWYHCDLITLNNRVVTLYSPTDLTSAISFGSNPVDRYTQPAEVAWIRDVLDCPFTIGNDTHDLMELFLPKTVSSESQGTFSDLSRYNTSLHGLSGRIMTGGGWWDSRPNGSGMFNSVLENYPDPGEAYLGFASRLSKT